MGGDLSCLHTRQPAGALRVWDGDYFAPRGLHDYPPHICNTLNSYAGRLCADCSRVVVVFPVLELPNSSPGGHRLGVNGLAVDRDNAIL